MWTSLRHKTPGGLTLLWILPSGGLLSSHSEGWRKIRSCFWQGVGECSHSEIHSAFCSSNRGVLRVRFWYLGTVKGWGATICVKQSTVSVRAVVAVIVPLSCASAERYPHILKKLCMKQRSRCRLQGVLWNWAWGIPLKHRATCILEALP